MESKDLKENECTDISIRLNAMSWWYNMTSLEKTRLCDIYTELIGNVRRWETLTGREIQLIYTYEKI